MRERQQNSTAHPINFLVILSADHISPAIGKTLTVTISKDGGSFAAPSGGVTEIGNGWYSLAGNATDRNTLGSFLLHASGSGCDPCDPDYVIVGYDPFDGQRLGLAALPSSSTLAVKPAVTLAAADVTGNLPANTNQFGGHAVALDSNFLPGVNIVDVAGAASALSAVVDANIVSINGTTFSGAASPATLTAAGLDAITVESGVNARQALSPILAAAAGVLIGAGTGTIVIKGGSVSVTRITATTDNAGNRTAVTLTLPT